MLNNIFPSQTSWLFLACFASHIFAHQSKLCNSLSLSPFFFGLLVFLAILFCFRRSHVFFYLDSFPSLLTSSSHFTFDLLFGNRWLTTAVCKILAQAMNCLGTMITLLAPTDVNSIYTWHLTSLPTPTGFCSISRSISSLRSVFFFCLKF